MQILVILRQSGSRWLAPAATVIGLFLTPPLLQAQSCPLCYQAASASGANFARALRDGILILFLPSLLIMGAIFYVAYRKRNQFNSSEGAGRIEFEFDEPGREENGTMQSGGPHPWRAPLVDTIEL